MTKPATPRMSSSSVAQPRSRNGAGGTRRFREASSGDGKKERTRALLLDTAIEVFARKGIGGASVLEITEAAGLSNGSFYYHFSDKDALIEAVGGAVAATVARETDEAMHDIVKGTERVALGCVTFIRRGIADPAWGRLIVRALADMGEFREQISSGIRKDVQIGIEQGCFDVQSTPALYAMLLGIVGATMHEWLEEPSLVGLDQQASQAILRVLGVRAREAIALSTCAVERWTTLSQRR